MKVRTMTSTNRSVKQSKPSGNGSHTGHRPSRRKITPSPYCQRKSVPNRVAALLLLIPGGAMMLWLIVLIRLTSKGPAIYRQLRVGKHGKTFTMYKLRTMYDGAEAGTGPVWTVYGDRRITLVGRFLRRFHLDELPQLINVIRGEMDLVGPRPERPEFAGVLAQQIPGYLQRLAVRPGITGLAQINLWPDETLDCVRRKLALDLEYLETANLSMDLRVLLCTLLRMFGVAGDRATRLMGMRRVPNVWLKPNGSNGKMVTPDLIARPRADLHRVNGSGGNGRASEPEHDSRVRHALTPPAGRGEPDDSMDAKN
jgi:lipopolysaccharide/colanic/teichoic acid biosynthesis glycosyltransferase